MRAHNNKIIARPLLMAGCLMLVTSCRPDIPPGVQGPSARCDLPETSSEDWSEVDIENVIEVLAATRDCRFRDTSDYEKLLTKYRGSIERWWCNNSNACPERNGAGPATGLEFGQLEEHPTWSRDYLWSANKLLDIQKRDRHEVQLRANSMERETTPAVYVWTDAAISYALHTSPKIGRRRKFGDPRKLRSEKIIQPIDALAAALENEGKFINNSPEDGAPTTLIEHRVKYISDSLLELAMSGKLDGDEAHVLYSPFDAWLAGISTRVPSIPWPTPVQLMVDPVAGLSTRTPEARVSVQRLRQDVSTFDDGNLTAFFRTRRAEQRCIQAIQENGWMRLSSIEARIVTPYDPMVIEAVLHDIVREFENIESPETSAHEAARWLMDFQPGWYGQARSADFSSFDERIQQAKAPYDIQSKNMADAEADIAYWEKEVVDLTARRKQSSPGRRRWELDRELAAAENKLEQATQHLPYVQAEFDEAERALRDAREARARVEATESDVDKVFKKVSAAVSGTGLCLLNAAVFEGGDPGDCDSTDADQEYVCGRPTRLRPVFEAGLDESITIAYTTAIVSRLHDKGIDSDQTCHAQALLNPDFIRAVELGHMAIHDLAMLLDRRVRDVSGQRAPVLASGHGGSQTFRWRRGSSENDYLAEVFEALVQYALEDFETACIKVDHSSAGACDLSVFVGQLKGSSGAASPGRRDVDDELAGLDPEALQRTSDLIDDLCDKAGHYNAMMEQLDKESADICTAHGDLNMSMYRDIASKFRSKHTACETWRPRLGLVRRGDENRDTASLPEESGPADDEPDELTDSEPAPR